MKTTANARSNASEVVKASSPQPAVSPILGDHDVYLFNEGTHTRLYDKLGSHVLPDGSVYFAVWAPNAQYVSVIGDFNHWDRGRHPMRQRGASGLWELTCPDAREGSHYKYHVASRYNDYSSDRIDPFGFMHGTPPRKESVVQKLDYTWDDSAWMAGRGDTFALDKPVSTYEMHLGSWMRVPEEGDRFLTYRELAPKLVEYLTHRAFTHVEFLPVMEHPFYGSWGYQTTGYFAPSSRFGSPQDLMYLIDQLHQSGIGVILDWVPSHFPEDEHALKYFDGTHLYEHADPRQGFHPDWKSAIFNYGRNEVRAFLISSAIFWLEKYHIDGLRVDAVASMLYLDYGRNAGEWIPNVNGGRENLEAVAFLRQLNSEVYQQFPGVQTIAEESTSWPSVSRPIYAGGLGFGYKWDMGWMNDTLSFFKLDPVYRQYHQNKLTFRSIYQYTENFVLPLSHDEIVHLKGSLLSRMPGDPWQQFANLRLLLASQWMQPGKKLLFMGGEFGQWAEWNHDKSLDWNLLWFPSHKGVQQLIDDMNRLYRTEPALHEGDCEPFGFQWIDADNASQSVSIYLRRARDPDDVLLVAINHTPVPRPNHQIGVPVGGKWKQILNTDAGRYWGSAQFEVNEVETTPIPFYGWHRSLTITLPPLSAVVFKPVGEPKVAGI